MEELRGGAEKGPGRDSASEGVGRDPRPAASAALPGESLRQEAPLSQLAVVWPSTPGRSPDAAPPGAVLAADASARGGAAGAVAAAGAAPCATGSAPRNQIQGAAASSYTPVAFRRRVFRPANGEPARGSRRRAAPPPPPVGLQPTSWQVTRALSAADSPHPQEQPGRRAVPIAKVSANRNISRPRVKNGGRPRLRLENGGREAVTIVARRPPPTHNRWRHPRRRPA
ncbi:translation initiation factor IF-2-like [Schistocerca americana]|uniref:translation initiation factor IF-2-like n=1 Tax=Schistocerca americana TaxID=7009 RepID=UPI001F4F2482|nr:translation initiation factor IF-2-like [Schistocerca americana]